MKIQANTVTRLLYNNLTRTRAYITLLSDATVYILKSEEEYETFLANGFPLKLYGVHEVKTYLGEIFVVSDTANTDIRVIEY